MEAKPIKLPEIVAKQYAELVKICESSKDGVLSAHDVAPIFGMNPQTITGAYNAGKIRIGNMTEGNRYRVTALQLYMYMMGVAGAETIYAIENDRAYLYVM